MAIFSIFLTRVNYNKMFTISELFRTSNPLNPSSPFSNGLNGLKHHLSCPGGSLTCLS